MILFFIVLAFLRSQYNLRELQYITEIFSVSNYNMLLGFFFTYSLLSLAGVPPFPGFTAKVLILQSVFIKGYFFLFFIVVLLSLLSAVYYVRFIRMLFFSDSLSYAGSLFSGNSFRSWFFVMVMVILQLYVVFHQLEIYEFLRLLLSIYYLGFGN